MRKGNLRQCISYIALRKLDESMKLKEPNVSGTYRNMVMVLIDLGSMKEVNLGSKQKTSKSVSY